MAVADTRLAVLAGALFSAGAALAGDQPVPFYPEEEAYRLARAPRVQMLDEETCEWIQGQRLADGTLAGPQRKAALFRGGESQEPFLRVRTREDGVHVSRFPARVGEVIVARTYVIDPRTRRYVYGKPTTRTCALREAEVGAPDPLR